MESHMNPGGVFDFLAGGTDHAAADITTAERMLEIYPTVQKGVLANRAFMRRATRHLAHAGIDQFLDVGTGIPTPPHISHTAQSVRPASKIVYAGGHPPTPNQRSRLLGGTPTGVVTHIHGDVRDPVQILKAAGQTLDFSRPIAVSLLAVLHFVPDSDDPGAIIRALMERVPPGSYLVLTHGTYDFSPSDREYITAAYASCGLSPHGRTRDSILGIIGDFPLVGPGLVPCTAWRPEKLSAPVQASDVPLYGAVCVKRGQNPAG